MLGLDPRIHLLSKKLFGVDGSPGQGRDDAMVNPHDRSALLRNSQ
jgi:hypothetical protein